jgi:uncharacterized protein
MDDAFEWDPGKAVSNFEKHGIAFDEAVSVFSDPLALFAEDRVHSLSEVRGIAIGRSGEQRLLVVVYAERGQAIRIISARRATRGETRKYEG